MLQNLPKDAAVFFLNPAGNALALAIRQAKAQYRGNCMAMPPDVVAKLSSFFPPGIFSGVCWAVVGGGTNLASLALHDGNMAAVTLEDVVVFADQQSATDPILWSHELTHVLQYRRLGVEGFAAIYAGAWDAIEQEARNFDQFVARNLQQQQVAQYWNTAPNWSPSQQISFEQYTTAARQFINPQWCTHFELQPGVVNVINSCPIPIRVTGFYLRNAMTGQVAQTPCTTQLCIIGPGTYSSWPDNPPWFTNNVFYVW